MMSINSLLCRTRINYHANFSDLSDRQREMLDAISNMIQQGEPLSEAGIALRISRTTDVKSCFWNLWKKGVLIT